MASARVLTLKEHPRTDDPDPRLFAQRINESIEAVIEQEDVIVDEEDSACACLKRDVRSGRTGRCEAEVAFVLYK